MLTLAAWVLAVSASTCRQAGRHAHVLPTPGLLRRIGADLLDAPRGVLTTVLPAPDHPELLVLVSATVWMAAFAGAETALRSGSTALPALPGVLMLAVPVALSTDAPGHGITAAAAAIGAAACCSSAVRRAAVRRGGRCSSAFPGSPSSRSRRASPPARTRRRHAAGPAGQRRRTAAGTPFRGQPARPHLGLAAHPRTSRCSPSPAPPTPTATGG
ncbi:hypothetical protein ACU686_05610 [Yinghuangia aomiensis]